MTQGELLDCLARWLHGCIQACHIFLFSQYLGSIHSHIISPCLVIQRLERSAAGITHLGLKHHHSDPSLCICRPTGYAFRDINVVSLCRRSGNFFEPRMAVLKGVLSYLSLPFSSDFDVIYIIYSMYLAFNIIALYSSIKVYYTTSAKKDLEGYTPETIADNKMRATPNELESRQPRCSCTYTKKLQKYTVRLPFLSVVNRKPKITVT